MQKTILFICLLINSLLFCADNQSPITGYHERVAHNTLQLQTSGIHRLRQMGIERYSLLAEANGQYMAELAAYHSKLPPAYRQLLIHDLEITRTRILINSDLQQALFEPVQTLLNKHIQLLPELYAHKVAINHVREECMSHMTEHDIKQCTDMWQKLDEEFKMAYLTTLDLWLAQSQKVLKEGISEHDCTLS